MDKVDKMLEEKLNQNLDIVLGLGPLPEKFGASFIQRVCQCGYNQAMWTLEKGVKRGIFKQSKINPWEFIPIITGEDLAETDFRNA